MCEVVTITRSGRNMRVLDRGVYDTLNWFIGTFTRNHNKYHLKPLGINGSGKDFREMFYGTPILVRIMPVDISNTHFKFQFKTVELDIEFEEIRNHTYINIKCTQFDPVEYDKELRKKKIKDVFGNADFIAQLIGKILNLMYKTSMSVDDKIYINFEDSCRDILGIDINYRELRYIMTTLWISPYISYTKLQDHRKIEKGDVLICQD